MIINHPHPKTNEVVNNEQQMMILHLNTTNPFRNEQVNNRSGGSSFQYANNNSRND